MKKIILVFFVLASLSALAAESKGGCSKSTPFRLNGTKWKTNCKITYSGFAQSMLSGAIDIVSLEKCEEMVMRGFEDLEADDMSFKKAKLKHFDPETCTLTKKTIRR